MQVVMGSLPHNGRLIATVILYMVCLFLNCKPLRNVATIKDYNSFLYNRSVPPHYQSFINEVHLLFDTLQDVMKTSISNCLNKTEETKGKSSTP